MRNMWIGQFPQLGIEAFAKREIATLSDGERQKALIARALAQNTPLLILDEPTAHLDYPQQNPDYFNF